MKKKILGFMLAIISLKRPTISRIFLNLFSENSRTM